MITSYAKSHPLIVLVLALCSLTLHIDPYFFGLFTFFVHYYAHRLYNAAASSAFRLRSAEFVGNKLNRTKARITKPVDNVEVQQLLLIDYEI